jgi:D-serine deaminase-like pyridoxal phosphate-dependent protein
MWTEIQAGSYVLMDATYDKLGLPFVQALYCVGTVISRHGDRGVINAGLKSLSVEYGLPEAIDSSMTVLGLSDEHARVQFERGNATEVGDSVLLVPSHVDPTMNLHDSLFVWREGDDLQEWPVVARSRHPSGVES